VVKRLILAATLTVAASPALADPLEFSSDPGPALNIARILLGQERGTPLGDDEKVTIALVDLDGDGTRDIIAFADASYFCGTAGCIPRLYRLERDTGHWSQLPIESGVFLNGEPSMWSTEGKGPDGWLNLLFSNSDMRIVLAWNGKAYSN
jgi:hypothetical protein